MVPGMTEEKRSQLYGATQLHQELVAAGLSIHGCSSEGDVCWKEPPTPDQETMAERIKAAHDPEKMPRERAVLLARVAELFAKGAGMTDAEFKEWALASERLRRLSP